MNASQASALVRHALPGGFEPRPAKPAVLPELRAEPGFQPCVETFLAHTYCMAGTVSISKHFEGLTHTALSQPMLPTGPPSRPQLKFWGLLVLALLVQGTGHAPDRRPNPS